MKKVINGKLYDTAKASYLGYYEEGDDLSYCREELYQKRTGEYFLYGVGGAGTRYAVATGINDWKRGEKIRPLDAESARKWAEEHLSAEEYAQIFALPDEDAEPVALYAQLPAPLVAAARQRAAEEGCPLTSVLERALAEYLK